MIENVIIVSYIPDESAFFGNSLIFETIRVGFPNAKITVADNGSSMEMLLRLLPLADKVGASVRPYRRMRHGEMLQVVFSNCQSEKCVLLDPDICFWEDLSDIDERPELAPSDFIIAGRHIPAHFDFVSGSKQESRLHTSFVVVNNVPALNGLIAQAGIEPQETGGGKKLYVSTMWEVTALAEQAGKCRHFPESILNAYDHIFMGTHPHVSSNLPSSFRNKWEKSYKDSQADFHTLRGAWRWQEEYFR